MERNTDNKYFIILYKLTRSLIFTSLSFEIILFVLYIMGNYQSFLDETQILILRTLSINSVFSFVLCFCSIVELIILIIIKDYKVPNIVRVIPIFLVLIFNVIMLSYATILLRLTEGI